MLSDAISPVEMLARFSFSSAPTAVLIWSIVPAALVCALAEQQRLAQSSWV
jgi:hypothetical protein